MDVVNGKSSAMPIISDTSPDGLRREHDTVDLFLNWLFWTCWFCISFGT